MKIAIMTCFFAEGDVNVDAGHLAKVSAIMGSLTFMFDKDYSSPTASIAGDKEKMKIIKALRYFLIYTSKVLIWITD
jgi:hypothetical protein